MMKMLNPESKFSKVINRMADYIILGVLWLVCCLPIFTIGAAQAGLYTGLKVLRDKEDDSSTLKAFFRGFKSGFGRITLVWCILALCMVLLGYNLVAAFIYGLQGMNAPLWMAVLGVFFCMVFQSLLTPFHASFGCTAWQLIRNVFFLFLAHPIRSIALTILTWGPAIVLAINLPLFLQGTIAWVAGYYSIAFSLNLSFMAKPFQIFTENFVAAYEEKNGEITLED